MINVLWARGNKGSWDAGLLMHAIRGDLWPLTVTFRETMGLVPEDPGGAVVVFAGRHMADEDGRRYLRAGLDKLPWALLYHLGDEELEFPSEQFRYPARRLALQCPNPFLPLRGDRNVPLGWPEDARAWLRKAPRLAASGRRLWSFAGQVNHRVREEARDALRARQEGAMLITDGFGMGLDREGYLDLVAHSSVVPCPAGNFSPETFRLYEALEAGAVPIPNRRAPNGGWAPGFDYWPWATGGPVPFPTVEEWSEVHAILDRFRDDPAYLQATMTRCLAWWIGQKRKAAFDLQYDCLALGAVGVPPPVTVLVSSSPIPSHPSLEVLEETLRRIRSYPELARAEVIVMCDGVRPDLEHRRNAYEEYLRVLADRCNWDQDWFGVYPLIFDEWLHQAECTRRALELVRTPLLFYVEADTFPMGEVPFAGLLERFAWPRVNHIRLHIFESVLEEHRPLYDDGASLTHPPLRATLQYSQRPHLARTDWYRKLLDKHFKPGDRTFIEDRLTSATESGEVDGLFVYSPEGSMLRSGTSDGRKDDPKAPILLVPR